MKSTNNQIYTGRLPSGMSIALLTVLLGNTCALADSNNFFGANAQDSSAKNQSNTTEIDENNVNAGLPGLTTQPTPPPPGSYTDDEKRMQHKYKDNIARAKQLIEDGDTMMKSADDKVSKKGKIKKEVGEKWLADLQANDPFAIDKDKPSEASSQDSSAKQSPNKKKTGS